MPSPFPGMDPYLESPALWPDVHHSLIFCIREALQPQLPLRYYALIEERIIFGVPERVYYPDMTVAREGSGMPTAGGPESTPRSALEADVAVEVEDEEEMRQGYVEIREASGGQVVTVIEVVSPANKAIGSRAHLTYLRKQADVLASNVNFVEIDLLRRGAHLLAVPELLLERVRPFDYLVCVHRAVRYGIYQLYARTLRQSLPRIAIPLRPEDGDVVLDLQAVLERCYDSAPYARLINYGAEPSTPLSPADASWADIVLRAQRLRGQ